MFICDNADGIGKEKQMKTDIVIIGCGTTGEAAAAWFSLRGKRVALCDAERFIPRMETIRGRGGILLRGNAGSTGRAMPELLTTNVAEALASSSRVLVCVPALRHEEAARLCRPFLTAEHCVLVVPGNMGSLVFRAVFAEDETCAANRACIAEMSDNLWACRTTGPAEVLAALPMKDKRVAALPAGDTPRVLEAFKDMLPLAAGGNVLETALNSPNVVTHVAGCVPNAAGIDRSGGNFAFFRDGLSASVIKCSAAVEAERDAVLERLGLARYMQVTALSEKLMQGTPPGFEAFVELDGPGNLRHRYVEEDAMCGMALLVSLAEACGVDVPVSRSLLCLAGVFNGTDYAEAGRNLKNLGLGGLAPREILARLG